jgi:hypothetical protein
VVLSKPLVRARLVERMAALQRDARYVVASSEHNGLLLLRLWRYSPRQSQSWCELERGASLWRYSPRQSQGWLELERGA